MTRVATLDEEMWTELFLNDADYLTHELEIFIQNLHDFLSALQTQDRQTLCSLLREGRELKATVGGC